jgi:hypothetical protein
MAVKLTVCPYIELKMDTVCSSEMIVSTFKSTGTTVQKSNVDILFPVSGLNTSKFEIGFPFIFSEAGIFLVPVGTGFTSLGMAEFHVTHATPRHAVPLGVCFQSQNAFSLVCWFST